MSEERIKALTEWIIADPNDPFLHYALALEYKKTGNQQETIHILQHTLYHFPDYLPVYYQLGIALEETARKQEAIIVYQAGLQKARAQKDNKTAGEISEAIQRLEFE